MTIDNEVCEMYVLWCYVADWQIVGTSRDLSIDNSTQLTL